MNFNAMDIFELR